MRQELYFASMDEVERYVAELRQELVPFRSAAVYDAETKEAVRLIKR